MKNLFTINETEKQRILEMHISATKKLYLNEQDEVKSTGDTTTQSGSTSTSSFVWAEDEVENKGKTQKELNELNWLKLSTYYGSSKGQTDPDTLFGKTAYIFKDVSDPKTQFVYLKSNVYEPNGSFVIGDIQHIESKQAVRITTKEGVQAPFVRLSISPVSLQKGKILYYKKYDVPVGSGVNSMFTYMYPYITSNPKYLRND